jgi:hypothetical protein
MEFHTESTENTDIAREKEHHTEITERTEQYGLNSFAPSCRKDRLLWPADSVSYPAACGSPAMLACA